MTICFVGRDVQAQFLFQSPGHRAAHRVCLPASDFDQLIQGRSIGALEQLNHLGLLAVFSCAGCFGWRSGGLCRWRVGCPLAWHTERVVDRVWVTDITYIRTWQGWLYLAVVLDLHSRAVVGWSMKPTIAKELVLDALMMAVWRRKPNQEVIVHSDQGSQYGSDDWKRFCDANQLLPSMSRRGNCWDNAVAESFFSSLKKERIRKRIYKTRDLARADVFDYIEAFYNRTRRHSHLGGVSPEAFERASI